MNISGKVFFDPDRASITGTGIASVPVALYNTVDGTGAVALTDSSGEYQFTNVSNGDYYVIESWGTSGVLTPVNFGSTAVAMTQPIEAEPPIAALTGVTLSPLVKFLDALTPNLLQVTISGGDATNINFFDGPVGNEPLVFKGISLLGSNLITVADGGSWGAVNAGSPIKTITPTAPYPGVVPGFSYTSSEGPTDGQYTVINTSSTGSAWWPISDHTTRLETGRYITVNGSTPGAVFFSQPTTVTANTDYLFAAWVMNLIKLVGNYANPVIGFRVKGSDGTIIVNRTLNGIDETSIPVWYQNGCLFNSGAYTSVTVELLSMGIAAGGNDFAVDDITLYKASLANQLALTKQSNKTAVYGGGSVNFTITMNNTLSVPATNVTFQDTLDSLLTFTPGSVKVNGSATGYESANPVTGFSIGTLAPSQSNIITFSATVATGSATIQNIARATYDALSSGNNDNAQRTVLSSAISLKISPYDYTQPLTDLLQGVTMEKKALAAILDSTSHTFTSMAASPTVTVTQMLYLEENLRSTIQAVETLESIFARRLTMIK